MIELLEFPLVTFALFTYNQERYVREAVEGVLAQTYEPLEIIISDDCSTDMTFSIVKELVSQYTGPHRLAAYKNQNNIGVNAHVNAIFSKAKGELIIVGAGDDISVAERTENVVKAWKKTGAFAIYCEAEVIDGNSTPIGYWDLPRRKTFIQAKEYLSSFAFYGAGAAYNRKIHEWFGPLPLDVRNEDYNLAWRAALLGGITYINKNLLSYRKHDLNLSFWSRLDIVKNFQERWSLKAQMHANTALNQKYVLDYVTEVCGRDSQPYKEYRSLMLSTMLHQKFYAALSTKKVEVVPIRFRNFTLTEYLRFLARTIVRAPEIARKLGCRLFRRNKFPTKVLRKDS